MISAVVLATDRPEPSGDSSLLQPLRGKPALQWVLENAIGAQLDEVICVVRNLSQIRPHILLSHEKLFWLVDYGADRSKAHALIAGLWSVNPRSDGVLFLRGNQPSISRPLIDTLIERFNKTNGWIVAPTFSGPAEPHNPMLFHRQLFPELIKLAGNQQAPILIDKYRDNTEWIDWDDALSSVEPKPPPPAETSKELN